jgi:hypothetical protein
MTKDKPTWTTTLPTVSGWYWMHRNGATEVVLVADGTFCVHTMHGGPAVFGIGFYDDALWSGPLKPPAKKEA